MKDDDGLSLSCAYDPPLTKQCSVVEGEMQLVEFTGKYLRGIITKNSKCGSIIQLHDYMCR